MVDVEVYKQMFSKLRKKRARKKKRKGKKSRQEKKLTKEKKKVPVSN